MALADIRIGQTIIGEERPPLLLPDIDMFFNGDIQRALDLVDRLKTLEMPVVKAAVISNLDIALPNAATETYLDNEGRAVTRDYRELLAAKVMTLEAHERLFSHVRSAGMDLVLSVYDTDGLELCSRVGAAAVKIPSSNINHCPLIRDASALGQPLIIDTGKSTIEEIGRAVGWARDAGASELIIEHSPEAPPAPVSRHFMSMIPKLRAMFEAHVGLSDHHSGLDMMIVATALGATILEKGLTEDQPDSDQDVYHAMEIGELGALKRRVEDAHQALGLGAERHYRADRKVPQARMGLIASSDLEAGRTIDRQAVTFAWPPVGVGAEHWPLVEGWRLRKSLAAGSVIDWSDIEAASDG